MARRRSALPSYNDHDLVTSMTDPLGRQTTYTYAANGIDIVAVRQTSSGLNDALASYAGYTAQHRATSSTDAAGQTTTSTYNDAGQVLTVTNPKSETTTYAYDANGRLQSITGPVSGATTTYTYDTVGRVHTVTNSDGYTVTTAYDAFDRPTTVTYPDGTTEQTVYDRLDVSQRRDRLGRTTRFFYDPLRRLVATRDPMGRTVTQQWCTCGSLDKLIDAKGQATTWDRDVQGRVTREIRADGTTATQYQYETTTSRLNTVTDPKGQVTTYTYNVDDTLQQTVFSNATIATPSVGYTYDAGYKRIVSMMDGTGTTGYTYHPSGELGAGQVAAADGPLTDDTITYGYDELGRVTTRAISGVGVTWAFDALGRVISEANVLGTFTYVYDGVTNRLASVTYPNGQTSAYMYFDNAGDRRLQTIHHTYPSGATLSQFDYTYNAVGNILTWRQQADATAIMWNYDYDGVDELTGATKSTTDPTPTILQRYAYGYDAAGNRTSEQIDDAVTAATHDSLNRLLTQTPGGALQVKGTVNEPSTVTIQGRPATVDATNVFRGTTPTTPGTNVMTVAATDASGNQATRQYQVTTSGPSKTFTYDPNGNLTSDGSRTFEWDARNQLLAVTVGTHRSEFTYDGQQRRVREIERESNVVVSDTRLVWCRREICEERDADSGTVTRRVFTLGEEVGSSSRYVETDHLGSAVAVTDGTANLLARYDFDPWGRRSLIAGTDVVRTGFGGYRVHPASSSLLALYRAYDPDFGRWDSEDPIGFSGGNDFYVYASNSPLNIVDPLGLSPKLPPSRTRTRGCNASETSQCQALCQAQGKGMESCRVSQTWSLVRFTDGKSLWKWKDGPMSCSCTDPDEPSFSCKENCQKVLMFVAVLGEIVWVCLTRLPPPVPVP